MKNLLIGNDNLHLKLQTTHKDSIEYSNILEQIAVNDSQIVNCNFLITEAINRLDGVSTRESVTIYQKIKIKSLRHNKNSTFL